MYKDVNEIVPRFKNQIEVTFTFMIYNIYDN